MAFRKRLNIVQMNMEKSSYKHENIMKSLYNGGVYRADIVAVQEPMRETRTTPMQDYTLMHHEGDPDCYLWTYKREATDHTLHEKLMGCLRVETDLDPPLYIFNVYNWDCTTNGPRKMMLDMGCLRQRVPDDAIYMVIGDFDLCHVDWGAPVMYKKCDPTGKVLARNFRGQCRTPKGMTTWRKGLKRSTIDLNFSSPEIVQPTISDKTGCDEYLRVLRKVLHEALAHVPDAEPRSTKRTTRNAPVETTLAQACDSTREAWLHADNKMQDQRHRLAHLIPNFELEMDDDEPKPRTSDGNQYGLLDDDDFDELMRCYGIDKLEERDQNGGISNDDFENSFEGTDMDEYPFLNSFRASDKFHPRKAEWSNL
ncbi:hypothetical protein G6011_06581 [Alternaria panax]|uniref:Uncharacterized protein n=1 Tax=Alternaria panax TaxID=48097 RepID=A0AAD4FGS0_9PLEO|nr:hypothetical protein G6011_06581 [Alternaria panax]